MNVNTIQLLNEFYQIVTDELPTKRIKSDWEPENKRGFFLGIIQVGDERHIAQLHQLLIDKKFKEQQAISTTAQLAKLEYPRTFIESMFDYYILPFHKNYSDSSSSSTAQSTNNSVGELHVPEGRVLQRRDLKRAVERRDKVCLFCWYGFECKGAHIIAQKNLPLPYEELPILARAGLASQHQVQNGLFLCKNCHSRFDKLQQYVDVVDDTFVLKVVNESIDIRSEKHKAWEEFVDDLKVVRSGRAKRWTQRDQRQSFDSNGEMALYFVDNNPFLRPNRKALEFHKAACLIWKMAGGAEPREEEFFDDDEKIDPLRSTYGGNVQDWVLTQQIGHSNTKDRRIQTEISSETLDGKLVKSVDVS